MKIFVTGGTGYIGEHFIPALLKEGHYVRLLVRDINKARKKFGNKCEYFIGDITNKDSLKGCCENIDIVYHMVAKVGNQLPSEKNMKAFREVNVEGTKNIIAECRGIKKFIFVSSIAAMGIVKNLPINEESKCEPYLPYQITKFEAEQIILENAKQGLPGIIIRPTKVYGVGEHEYSYLTLAKLCQLRIFPKIGKGYNYTSNIYISDFVCYLVKLINKGRIGEIYNLTSNESIKFVDVGRLIAKVLNKNILILPIPSYLMIKVASIEEKIFNMLHKKPIATKKNIEAIITDRIYDISKAKVELDFTPLVSMEDGIVTTIKWYIETKKI